MRIVTLAVIAILALVVQAAAGLTVEHAPHQPGVLSFTRRGTGGTAGMGDILSGYKPCDPDVKQYSGYFDINATENKHYFFWAFEARQNASTAPVILWLTGGPGCSSGLAVLAENGPCKVTPHLGVVNNTFSWNNIATVIYIDQPAGVGYSYSDNDGLDHNEAEVGDDMYLFMQSFYSRFPQFQQNPLFVYGESYGGHFAPAVAHRLFVGNQRKQGIHVPLRGLSTGNGITDALVQDQYYAELAYDWCNIVLGYPCVNRSVYNTMVSLIPPCVALITSCNTGNRTACYEADDVCGYQMGAYAMTGRNVYDIRKPCEGELCYNLTAQSDFFNLERVQKALLGRTVPRPWAMCNGTVNGMFGSDWMHDFNQLVPPLLEAGIRVLVYAGDMDFICNWIGNKAWTVQLPWANHSAFAKAEDVPWYLDEVPAGIFRTVASATNRLHFTFLQIHGAGHMVPMDQPHRALEMVRHFLLDKPFH